MAKLCDPPPTWKRAEEEIIDEYDLTEEHTSWYDARARDGEYVEIKSCACQYDNGEVGKFEIWEYQWFELMLRGQFGLLVYSPESYEILATHMTFPDSLESVGTVVDRQHPTMGRKRLWKVPWPALIPLDAVELGVRCYFVDHYSEEEVEDTVVFIREGVND